MGIYARAIDTAVKARENARPIARHTAHGAFRASLPFSRDCAPLEQISAFHDITLLFFTLSGHCRTRRCSTQLQIHGRLPRPREYRDRIAMLRGRFHADDELAAFAASAAAFYYSAMIITYRAQDR